MKRRNLFLISAAVAPVFPLTACLQTVSPETEGERSYTVTFVQSGQPTAYGRSKEISP
ncbi:MAG: hypothetical protein SOT34_03990 [Candidatus Borkfalkiaceae bacterium]|nr:hypothetical protein [Christensenellaceae bacterium]